MVVSATLNCWDPRIYAGHLAMSKGGLPKLDACEPKLMCGRRVHCLKGPALDMHELAASMCVCVCLCTCTYGV